MARKFFRRFVPSRDKVAGESSLRWLRPLMNKPYLWHLNRHSVAKGVAFGLFWCVIPIPMQSLPACLMSIWRKGNVPLALAATWVSNPLTLLPHWWLAYKIGRFILQTKSFEFPMNSAFWVAKMEPTRENFNWFVENFWHFYLPLTIGSIVMGLVLGPMSYLLINWFWRYTTAVRWRKRGHTDLWKSRLARRRREPAIGSPVKGAEGV